MPRPPDSRRSRIKQEPTTGSGRKRDPGSRCAGGCGRALKYDSKWPVCLGCANRQLGLVGKALLTRRLKGQDREQIHADVDELLDRIDGYNPPEPVAASRRPRPGRSATTPRTRLRAPGRGRRAGLRGVTAKKP